MTFKISSTFLVVLVTLLLVYGNKTKAPTSADIKRKVLEENATKYIGIGGRYGRLLDIVSKSGVIESDHFPPKSVYQYAKHDHIKEINYRDMAAVSISYEDHRKLMTTGSGKEQGGFMNPWLSDEFSEGDYYKAIVINIKLYAEDKILNRIKKGVMDALSVHVANKLINKKQEKDLIDMFHLDTYDKKFERNKDRMEAVKKVQG